MFFYQPSLLGLLLYHFSFAEYQYRTYGFLSYQTIIYVAFWWTYLITHYIKEEFMITTWDIIEERKILQKKKYI
jgi:Delta14-sterol reductase